LEEKMKKAIAVILCFAFMAMGNALAVDLPRHSVKLGTEVSHIKYEEAGLMKETGTMFGIAGSYVYHNKIMLKAEARGAAGKVDYDGQLSDGTPYTIDGIRDFMFEPRILIGFDMPYRHVVLTPYAGIGYRALWDKMGKDAIGYDRQSNYLYAPLGIEALIELNRDWSLGTTAEADMFIRGLQHSYLSQCDVGYGDITNKQTQGYGLRGAIRLIKKSRRVDIEIEPFVRYWHIEDSEAVPVTWKGTIIGYGYEPENNSTEIGAKIAIKF
jgi:hypothetical protein